MERSKKLESLFASILKIDVNHITDATSVNNTRQWDSLITMQLVTELEDAFGITLTAEEILSMKSVGAVREILKKRGTYETA